MPEDVRQSDNDSEPRSAGVAADVAEEQRAGGPAESEVREGPEALRAELDELREKYLRVLAEVRNVQQRALRDKQESLRYAEGDFARELLPIIDDLERTIESGRQHPDSKSLTEAVRIIYDHLMKVLRNRHIEPIPALGQPFDSHVHQAVAQQPSNEHAAGTVIGEVARGYRMRERVLRPGQVIVSSGPSEAG